MPEKDEQISSRRVEQKSERKKKQIRFDDNHDQMSDDGGPQQYNSSQELATEAPLQSIIQSQTELL